MISFLKSSSSLQQNLNIWKDLKAMTRPFFCLAPMYDVTDSVFRDIICKTAKPDLFFTEFVSCDALTSPKGQQMAMQKLKYTKKQRPVIAQIWGITPKKYYEGAKLIAQMGFDGIDINMGCPQKSVLKHGVCSGLIKNPELAEEIIRATKYGAENVPVSVKTRTGFNQHQTEEWIEFLLKQDIAALTLHARTVKDMSKVPADWEQIKIAVDIRNNLELETPIVGNGDVLNYDHGIDLAIKYGCDGLMIGRGIFKNLWAFSDNLKDYEHTEEKYLPLLKEHIQNFTEAYPNPKSYNILKKFYKVYVTETPGSKSLRADLMETTNADQAIDLINEHLAENY